ncbi:MAG: metallophosphoesterase [Clostridia bacterium]|nr:metallophosphoesterase [Clostridia bacterium]
MRTFFREKKFAFFVTLYSLCCALFWTALRVNYAGISKALGADHNQSFIIMYLPVLVLAFTWLVFIVSALVLLFRRSGRLTEPSIILFILCIIETGLCAGVVIGGSYDYLDFILPKFFSTLAVSLVFILLLVLSLPFERKKLGATLRILFLLLLVFSAVVLGFDLRPNFISTDAVVYAVEDTYQIVFSTHDESLAWVKIGNDTYYDLYAGSMKSNDHVHKITVPQSALDNAKEYTIYAEQVYYRGPFGAFKGKVLEKTHKFRPVNSADGISYYAMSDVHGCFDGATSSAKSVKDLDFLVLLGDITSMVEYERDANFANKVAFEITKGEMPVVYLRGNHEIKGKYAEDLYKYVGSKDGKFYYTFTLSDIYGIALDLGEDHDDDWWEYYESAQFDLYRDEQTEFLNSVFEKKEYKDYSYTMVCCHIPVPFVNSRKNHEVYKKEWTSIINAIRPDIFLSGHQHDLTPLEPGAVIPETTLCYNGNFKGDGSKEYNGYMTDFHFTGFITSRPFKNEQVGDDIKLGKSYYTGLHVLADLDKQTQTARYINAKGETVPVCNMFGEDSPRTEFTSKLVIRKMPVVPGSSDETEETEETEKQEDNTAKTEEKEESTDKTDTSDKVTP